MSELQKRAVKVITFRETVPKNPTKFEVKRTPNSTEITDLRVQFRVRHNHTKHPNSCDITITNLASRTRVDLETKPLLVQLDAGYGDDLKLLFTGDLRFGMTKQQGTDWETLLQLGDGDCMHRWARVNKSYAPGTSVRTILRDAVGSMGFTMPANLAKDKRLDQAYPNGRASHGYSRDELSKLLGFYGYRYSTQKGVLRILRDNETSSLTALPLDKAHGMIGTPEFGSPPRSGKPPHMTVKMLLYPELTPGDLVKLTSEVKNGLFRLETVTHTGDTHGTGDKSWTTEVEIKPVEAPGVAVPETHQPTRREQLLEIDKQLRIQDL